MLNCYVTDTYFFKLYESVFHLVNELFFVLGEKLNKL